MLQGKKELLQLNTLRNNIKHQGIQPHRQSAFLLLQPIHKFFVQYTQEFFGLDWESIGLSDLIDISGTQTHIKNVEAMIEKGAYKSAMELMASIKFDVFDATALRIRLDPRYDLRGPSTDDVALRKKPIAFLENNIFSDYYERIDLLEKGISREGMYVFERLTAKVGYKNDGTWHRVMKYGDNWSKPNWTKQNALWCYNFLVDAIVKNQRRLSGYSEQMVFTVYTIKAKEDLTITTVDPKGTYTMHKNEERLATISDRVDGEWQAFEGDTFLVNLMSETGKGRVTGFVPIIDRDKIEFIETEQSVIKADRQIEQVGKYKGG